MSTTDTARTITTRTYSARVDADGYVTVWDSIAGHYTTWHSLTPAQERWIGSRSRRLGRCSRASGLAHAQMQIVRARAR